jgi:HD-like signal output (HDOD) protein
LLANRWELSADLREVVALHHSPQESRENAGLVALVELSDLLCRMSGLNYGYTENREVNLLEQGGFAVLSQQCRDLENFDWARLTFELDSYMDEVHALVRAIYRN